MSERVVYFNDRFVPQDEARISVFNGGWMHGAGLFETMRAENGRVFRYESHVERLRMSAREIIRPIERSELPDQSTIDQLLKHNQLASARLRLTVSAGMIAPQENAVAPLIVIVTAEPLVSHPAELYEHGVRTMLSPYRQCSSDPLAGHKTTCYLPRLLSLRAAREAGCHEAIWFSEQNLLAEGAISNVFLVRDGVLKTPPVDTPVLPGIARSLVLHEAAQSGIATSQESLTINDLLDADEVFLTNSLIMVLPVIAVEKRDIGDGKVGPLAPRLLETYRSVVRKECGCP